MKLKNIRPKKHLFILLLTSATLFLYGGTNTFIFTNKVLAQNCNYACGGSPHCCGPYECAGYRTCNPKEGYCYQATLCPDGSRICGGSCPVPDPGPNPTPNPNPNPPPASLICDNNTPMDPLCQGKPVGAACGSGGTCQATNAGWANYRACSCGGQCNPISPIAPVPLTPTNASILPTMTSATVTWSNTSWGSGCPSNINMHYVYYTINCTGAAILGGNTTGNTLTINGLTAGTSYCWFVHKSNGSIGVNSAVSSFRTNSYPNLYYGGQAAADVCGTGTSGRAGPANVTNPIRLSFGIMDAEADTPNSLHVALVPRSVSGGAGVIPNALVTANVGTWSSIYISMGYGSGNTYWVSQYHPLTGWTGSGVGTPEFTVGNGVAKVLNIGNTSIGTYGTVSGTNVNTSFQIRFENSFGSTVNNPSGTWDIYGIYVNQTSDGATHPSYGTWDWIRMGQWNIDLTLPSALVSGPSYNADGTFNITYNASDNLGVLDVVNYITRSSASSTLRDNIIGQELSFDFTPNVHRGSLNISNYLTQPVRNYRDTSTDQGNQFNFRIDVIDRGCNFVSSNINASQPVPWLMTYNGNVSVNGNSIVNGVISGINIPDPIIFNINGLPGFSYNDGVIGPFFSTHSSISGTSNSIARPSANISKLRKYVLNYNNEAVNAPSGGGWYDYLKNLVKSNTSNISSFTTTSEISVGNTQFPVGQQYSGNLSSIFSIAANEKKHVDAQGNIWFAPGSVCDIKSIIFVDGNLRIGPNLTTTPGNACIFVVKGNVSIGIGTTGPQIPLNSSTQPYYDIIEASLISDTYIWSDNNSIGTGFKGEGLYIRGSVITTGYFEWNRDLNTSANAVYPAVLVNNDPIYYQIFRNDLRVKDYSIRELN